jgi:hypothetical protein
VQLDASGGGFLLGESLTTTHVMPAATPTTHRQNRMKASTPRTFSIANLE